MILSNEARDLIISVIMISTKMLRTKKHCIDLGTYNYGLTRARISHLADIVLNQNALNLSEMYLSWTHVAFEPG